MQAAPLRYVVNGVPSPELTLTRGTTYTFAVHPFGHPFYITRDAAGGPGAPGEETVGVTGSRAQGTTLTFTPDASHLVQLYYQCTVHAGMGNKINVID